MSTARVFRVILAVPFFRFLRLAGLRCEAEDMRAVFCRGVCAARGVFTAIGEVEVLGGCGLECRWCLGFQNEGYADYCHATLGKLPFIIVVHVGSCLELTYGPLM